MTITFTVAVDMIYEPPELLVEPSDQYVFDEKEVSITHPASSGSLVTDMKEEIIGCLKRA